MTASSTATTQLLSVNGLRMQVTTAGAGPLVLLCHGCRSAAWPRS